MENGKKEAPVSMKPFIPFEKLSKKAQRELFRKQRGTWGAISPVTRRSPDPKAYRRRKTPKGEETGEPSDVDFSLPVKDI